VKIPDKLVTIHGISTLAKAGLFPVGREFHGRDDQGTAVYSHHGSVGAWFPCSEPIRSSNV
jgi:hypothetical protein